LTENYTLQLYCDFRRTFEILIGKDFLDTVELNVKLGVTTISPISMLSAEIYQITDSVIVYR